MEHQALKELYIDELKDIYNAENQLVKALPKMAKAANSEELRTGFEEHLEHLDKLLGKMELAKLALNPKKCWLGFQRIQLLGHIVDQFGISWIINCEKLA